MTSIENGMNSAKTKETELFGVEKLIHHVELDDDVDQIEDLGHHVTRRHVDSRVGQVEQS